VNIQAKTIKISSLPILSRRLSEVLRILISSMAVCLMALAFGPMALRVEDSALGLKILALQ